MSPKRVTPTQRQVVFARAQGRCEYCHTPDGFVPGSFAVEHIVPRSKGGKTTLANLALSCPACNGHKYNKVEGYEPLTSQHVRLFNPRKQHWSERIAFILSKILITMLSLQTLWLKPWKAFPPLSRKRQGCYGLKLKIL
jgi:hypothetical protein